jgi:hypothetical protein
MAKCKGSQAPIAENGNICSECGESFSTKTGLSQHERHKHPLIRNEKRATAAGEGATRSKPKGYGQVWSEEEVELMLRLEIELQNERNIAQKMCQPIRARLFHICLRAAASNVSAVSQIFSTVLRLLRGVEMNHILLIDYYLFTKYSEILRIRSVSDNMTRFNQTMAYTREKQQIKIRDKRAEATYKPWREERLLSYPERYSGSDPHGTW